MDKRTEEKEAEKIEIERKSVKALKERYANIKSVEIKKSGFDINTGAFNVTVKMTNKEYESVNFTYTYWVREQKLGLDLLVDEKVQVRGTTSNTVLVIYSNGKDGEV